MGGAALYLHLSGVFVFLVHGAIFAVLWLRRRGKPTGSRPRTPGAREAWPFLGFLLAALVTLTLYAVLLPQMVDAFGSQATAGTTRKVAEWTNPLWTLLEIADNLPVGIFGAALAGVAGAAIACCGGLVVRAPSTRPSSSTFLLTPPLTLAALLALSFHLWPRYGFSWMGFGGTRHGARGCSPLHRPSRTS